jgi:hypothetical protein
MQFNPKALLILVGFGVLLTMAVSSNGGPWFHFAEAVSTVVILIGVAGFLNGSRSRGRKPSN